MQMKIELPVKEIVEKWKNGMSQQALSEEYGVLAQTIRDRINEYYESIGETRPKKKIIIPKKEIIIEEIIQKWENGTTTKELAEEYGIPRGTMYGKIRKYYEYRERKKPEREKSNPKIELPVQDILEQWKNGVSQAKLAKKYGVSIGTINNRINEAYEEERITKKEKLEQEILKRWQEGGVTLKELETEFRKSKRSIARIINDFYKRKQGILEKNQKRIELPIEEIIEKWLKGSKLSELAEEYGVSGGAISDRIDEYYSYKEREEKRVLKSASVVASYLYKGLTPDQIRETAKKSKITIPDDIMQKGIERFEKMKHKKREEER